MGPDGESHVRLHWAESAVTVEFLAAIIEHVAHPIFVKDRAFRFVLLNRALCEMVGFPREQMLGKTDYDFFPKEQSDFFRKKDAEMFTTGSVVTIDEEPITDAAGQLHVLQTVKVPYRDGSGQVTHLVGIISDITKIKQAEAELLSSSRYRLEVLKGANEELERRVRERTAALRAAEQELTRKDRLAALGELAGGLAHQLRNPLGAIQNAVSLLRHGSVSAPAAQAVDVIAEEVMRADSIIHGLLDYARVRSAEPREVALGSLVEEAIDQQRLPAGVQVRLDIDSALTVCVDPLQVQSALGNVIRNAVEAMPAGGVLSLRSEQAGALALLYVTDSGEGVPELTRARLFDPLVTSKSQGIGLGLSTARNLVEAQGGSIDHEPSDRGATFVIRLPLACKD